VQQARPNSLRGAFVNIYWRDLEVGDGKFDWSAFDLNLTKAVQNGLQVQPLVYIYDCAHPLPTFVTKIPNATVQVYRNGGPTGPLYHAPKFSNPAFQDRWHRVIKALATHLAGLPDKVKRNVWASQVVAGITGDNRPWKGRPKNPADAISASAWIAYTRSVADMFIDAFLPTGIPVVANLQFGFSLQQDQGWFLSRAYTKGMRGASVKEGLPSHFYNLNSEDSTFKRDNPLLMTPQPDGSFAYSRGEMDGGVQPETLKQGDPEYGNWAQSPWWSLQASAEWGLTFGLDVWNVNSGFLSNTSFVPTLDFFNRHAGQRLPHTASAAFISFRDSLDTADVKRWPVDKYGPVDSDADNCNADRMYKIQQANMQRGAKLPKDDTAFASKASEKQKKAKYLYDVCWQCFPGNYGKYMTQVDPDGTSVGYWQLGPVDQLHGRFARGLEHSTGKNTITVELAKNFGGSVIAKKQALVRVVYFDQGGGSWALGYNGAQIASVKKHHTKTWLTTEVNMTFAQSRTFTLTSLDGEDDVFSLLEVLLHR
jgi:hypothetical protein